MIIRISGRILSDLFFLKFENPYRGSKVMAFSSMTTYYEHGTMAYIENIFLTDRVRERERERVRERVR